jgi:hypothetical protein
MVQSYGTTDVNNVLLQFQQKLVDDQATDVGTATGAISYDSVSDAGHFGPLNMKQTIEKGLASSVLKAGDTFEVTLAASHATTATAAARNADTAILAATAPTTANRLVLAMAATLSNRATAMKKFAAGGNASDGSTIASEDDVEEAICLAAAYAEKPDNSSVVNTGMSVVQKVIGANLKFVVTEFRPSAGGAAITGDSEAYSGASTHALITVTANTQQELGDVAVTKYGAQVVVAPTADEVRAHFFVSATANIAALKRAQGQLLALPYGTALKWVYGSETTTGSITAPIMALIRGNNYGLFDIKPTIAHLNNAIGLGDVDKTFIADADDVDWNGDINALPDTPTASGALKAKYLKTNVAGNAPTTSTFNSDFRFNPEFNTASTRAYQFYIDHGYAAKGTTFTQMVVNLGLTDTSSDANGYQRLVKTAATSSAVATETWTTTASTLKFAGEMMATGYNSAYPINFVPGGDLFEHLAQSTSDDVELPVLTGSIEVLKKVPLSVLVGLSESMLGPDNELYKAYVKSAQRNASVKNGTKTMMAELRTKMGTAIGKNNTNLPLSEAWPTQAESAHTIKVSMSELLKTCIDNYTGATNADKNARFSAVNITALVNNGDAAARKANATDTYKKFYCRVVIFQAASSPNELALAATPIFKDELAIAWAIANISALNLDEEGRVKFILKAIEHEANDSISMTDLRLLVDTMGASSIKHFTNAHAATASHIGTSMAAVAADQIQSGSSSNRQRMYHSAGVLHFFDMANVHGGTVNGENLSVADGKWLKSIYENNKQMFVSAVSDVVFNVARHASDAKTITEDESTEFLHALIGYGMSDIFAELDVKPLDVAVSAADSKAKYLSVFRHVIDNYSLTESTTLGNLIASVTVGLSQEVARAVEHYNNITSNTRYVNKNSATDMTALFSYSGLSSTSTCQVLITIRAYLGEDRQLLALFGADGLAQADKERDWLMGLGLTIEILEMLAYSKPTISGWTIDAVPQKMVYLQRIV